jgi:hypothetical protein
MSSGWSGWGAGAEAKPTPTSRNDGGINVETRKEREDA